MSESANNSAGGPVLIDNSRGDVPLARFGHTTTYMGNFAVILFGGAVGDTGRYMITNDLYSLDLASFEWSRLISEDTPSPRAAHAAACVDSLQFVIYGGATGGGSLSTDELYLLDLRKDPPLAWMSVPITGVTPGRRYGHSMTYHGVTDGHHRPNLIVFGGNDGSKTLADIWYMDVQRSPFSWNQVVLPPTAKQPAPRVYHSAEICRDGPAYGMMVVFGGRTTDSRSLRDTWGLRQHRDGRWDWVDAPIKRGGPPEPRFQHNCVFFGSKMLVIGGRDSDVTRALPTSVYDTEACEWRSLPSVGRFRHASWAINSVVYAFGGFDHKTQSHPTADILALNVAQYPGYFSDKEITEMKRRPGPLPWEAGAASVGLGPNRQQSGSSNGLLTTSGSGQQLTKSRSSNNTSFAFASTGSSGLLGQQAIGPGNRQGGSAGIGATTMSSSENGELGGAANSFSPAKRMEVVRLSTHAVTKIDSPHNPDFSALVRKISIDRLEEAGRKLRGNTGTLQPVRETANNGNEGSLADYALSKLLRPNVTPSRMTQEFNSNDPFCLSWVEVSQLCTDTYHLVRQEPMILSLRAPIKVYGDIHGQFYDLMRLFGSYKAPVEEDWAEENDLLPPEAAAEVVGDIDSNDYLFLGDFVDRGTHSLEVICLLFALKCKYPKQVHLIRGNHEDRAINSVYGFSEECKRRLREDTAHQDSCWDKFNRVFDYLPVGALIENKIICIHGGIGGSINTLADIADLRRPLSVSQMPRNDLEQRVTDLLWSDPTDNDSVVGVIPNLVRDQDGTGRIYKFGPDRVEEFLKTNNLDLIIRAHECVMDGFERFAGGKLITLFSATDYCGHHNAGALLFIRRDLTVIPKIIYPPDRDQLHLGNTWLTMDSSRPPTPPRSIRREKDHDLGF